MEDKKHTSLFDSGRCLTSEEMFAYEKGNLTPAEMNRVEKHLLDCVLCAEAVEGIRGADQAETEKAIAQVTDQAWMRVGEIERKRRRKAVIWLTSAAASVILVVGLFFLNKSQREQKMEEVFTDAFKVMPAPAPSGDPAASKPDATVDRNLFSDNTPVTDLSKEFEKSETGTVTGGTEAKKYPGIAGPVIADKNNSTDAIISDFGSDDFVPGEYYALEDLQDAPKDINQKASDSLKDNKFLAMDNSKVFGGVEGNLSRSEVQTVTPGDYRNLQGQTQTKNELDLKEEREKNIAMPKKRDNEKSKTMSAYDGGRNNNANGVFNAAPRANNDITQISVADTVSFDMDETVADDGDQTSGYTLHNEGKYQEATEKFRQDLQAKPSDANARLYYGIDLLAINKPSDAIAQFDLVLSSGNASQKEDALWYKALAYLKLKDSANAKKLLNDIASRPGKYQQNAKDTLKQL